MGDGLYQQIYEVVRMIPEGRVATYGQIAELIGIRSARVVGYAMAACRDPEVPWQRVVNSRGQISPRAGADPCLSQRQLLESEGVQFSRTGRIDFMRFGWPGPGLE